MATTTARSRTDVDKMSSRERLWDSLNYAYGQKRESSDEQFRKAYSQADRQMLSRGMQRSSYGAQTLANLDKQRVDASNDIYSEQIADYENRLRDIEQQEIAQDQWERQFAEGQRQFDTNLEFQRGENALNRAFQTSEREAQQGWQSGENALNRQFQTSEREAQQAYSTSERIAQQFYNTSEREAQQAYQTGERQAQQAYQSGENALNRAFQTSEREAQQAYNTGEREASQQYQSGENALNRAFQTSEREAQQTWQSGENALNRALTESQSEQQLAASWVQAIVANGKTPSKSLLKLAGISEKDAKKMIKQAEEAAKSSGGGSRSPAPNPGPTGDQDTNPGSSDPVGEFVRGFQTRNRAGVSAGISETASGGVKVTGKPYQSTKNNKFSATKTTIYAK